MSSELIMALNLTNTLVQWLAKRNLSLEDLSKRQKESGGSLTIEDLEELSKEAEDAINSILD